MDRKMYLAQDDIREFVTWLIANLPTLPIHLRIPKSRMYVPDGLDKAVIGVEGAQACYQWSGDWMAVSAKLKGYRESLRNSAYAGEDETTYKVCREILRWGGVDNARTIAFLEKLKAKKDLAAYLKRAEHLLALDTDNRLSDITPSSVQEFNSGLTKIHALFDTTGSPIYDGRVGAAIAALYHLYRSRLSNPCNPPANHSRFAWDAGRGCQLRDPQLLGLGFEGTPKFNRDKPNEWAQRQLQLGWIIREVLDKSPELFRYIEKIDERCHHFEAGLFMMGYDLRALVSNGWKMPEPHKLLIKRLQMQQYAANRRKRLRLLSIS